MKTITSIFLLLLPVCGFAQTEKIDSLLLKKDLHPELPIMESEDTLQNEKKANCSLPSSFSYTSANDPFFVYRITRPIELNIPDLTYIPGQATIASWPRGEVVATGGSMVMPGLMKIDSGSIGVFQQIGSLSLYVGATANKYGYFRGLHTQYGLNGSVSYQFSPNFSFTAFGTYYFGRPPMMANGMPMPPSMAGYYGMTKFGGYIDYQINEHFGVEVGGQTVQQITTGRYEAEPIVTPYVNIGNGNKKIHIGLPVGQILYGILRKR